MKIPVYLDENCNKLEFFINQDNKLFFVINSEMYPTDGYIILDKEDLKQLIDDLKSLYNQM